MSLDIRMPSAPAPRPRAAEPRPTPWGQVVGLVLVVAAVLAVVLTAFAWPAVNVAPRELPLVVAGPPGAADRLVGQLAEAVGEEAFAVSSVADRTSAEGAVRDREAYGAVVLGPAGGEVLVAGAASPAVAQSLRQLAAGIPQQAGGPFPVTDLVPLPVDDPRGVGLPSAVLPLVIGGIAAGAAAGLRVSGTGRRVLTVLGIASGGGVVLTAVLQLWLGALAGPFWLNAGVAALGMAAVGTTLLGLYRFLGHAGLGLGAATMVLLGNPLSGVTSAPEMLPGGWAQLGQLLPPGATGTALRSVAWFDGAGSGQALLVLAGWLLVGLALSLVPRRSAESEHAAVTP